MRKPNLTPLLLFLVLLGITLIFFYTRPTPIYWVKDSFVSLKPERPLDNERVFTPCVFPLGEGGYRLYYSGLGTAKSHARSLGYLMSARSDDGIQWTREDGVRIDSKAGTPYSRRVLSAHVFELDDKSLRLYFEGGDDKDHYAIFSARSTDGLQWTVEEGYRLYNANALYGTPRAIRAERNGVKGIRLYFFSYPLPLKEGISANNHILSAFSVDGLKFEIEEGVRIPQQSERESYSVYSPELLPLSNGIRMYYVGWSNAIHGGIFSASSRDGLHFKKERGPLIDLDTERDRAMVSHPTIYRLKDGTLRMLYEAFSEDGANQILGATASSRRPTRPAK